MDNKRLLVAIALSVAILAVFQWLLPHRHNPGAAQQVAQSSTKDTPPGAVPAPTHDSSGTQPAPVAPPAQDVRLLIAAPRVHGSINLTGGRLDDLVLNDYRETVSPHSPQVRVLEASRSPQPNYIQFGWSAPSGSTVAVPGGATAWTADGKQLSPGHPVTLSWDNGAGLTFQLVYSIDDNFMFGVEQRVRNATGQPVSLFPWSRVSRGYEPVIEGSYLVHEGPLGVFGGRLEERDYKKVAKDGAAHGGTAFSAQGSGGWAGITDKYWLTALLPDSAAQMVGSYRYVEPESGNAAGAYQIDFVTQAPQQIAPGQAANFTTHAFAGAKEVHLLDTYQTQLHVADFWKAVDFGWFAFLTKPIFFVLDWLNTLLGNFGLALMGFTLIVKVLFFPLANKSFRSMSKMKLLAPKLQAVRERNKDDPVKQQQEMMALYRAEKVNPASGCLPMLVQIPVFWCLYKDLYVTIEMRHAPFFGWIRDLSAPDPTNLFNLFGLIPFDPAALTPFLHLGFWPIILGITMFLQQRMNPPPPDPAQQRIFMMMPLIFMFVLARQPAGLVIYYCWNNILTVGQQWLIQRQTRLGTARTQVARG